MKYLFFGVLFLSTLAQANSTRDCTMSIDNADLPKKTIKVLKEKFELVDDYKSARFKLTFIGGQCRTSKNYPVSLSCGSVLEFYDSRTRKIIEASGEAGPFYFKNAEHAALTRAAKSLETCL